MKLFLVEVTVETEDDTTAAEIIGFLETVINDNGVEKLISARVIAIKPSASSCSETERH